MNDDTRGRAAFRTERYAYFCSIRFTVIMTNLEAGSAASFVALWDSRIYRLVIPMYVLPNYPHVCPRASTRFYLELSLIVAFCLSNSVCHGNNIDR